LVLLVSDRIAQAAPQNVPLVSQTGILGEFTPDANPGGDRGDPSKRCADRRGSWAKGNSRDPLVLLTGSRIRACRVGNRFGGAALESSRLNPMSALRSG